MTGDVTGLGEYVDEVTAGQCAIVAALVIALHETGVLPQDKYRDALNRLWSEMPEEEAVGEAGAVIERVLDLLDARACTASPSDGRDRTRKISAFNPKVVNDDAIAQPRSCAVLRR